MNILYEYEYAVFVHFAETPRCDRWDETVFQPCLTRLNIWATTPGLGVESHQFLILYKIIASALWVEPGPHKFEAGGVH